MPSVSIDWSTSPGGSTYKIRGLVDLEAVRNLDRLLAAERADHVALDFRSTEGMADASLAILSAGLIRLLSDGNRDVQVVGLRAHHERVLSFFGISTEEQGRVALRDEASRVGAEVSAADAHH